MTDMQSPKSGVLLSPTVTHLLPQDNHEFLPLTSPGQDQFQLQHTQHDDLNLPFDWTDTSSLGDFAMWGNVPYPPVPFPWSSFDLGTSDLNLALDLGAPTDGTLDNNSSDTMLGFQSEAQIDHSIVLPNQFHLAPSDAYAFHGLETRCIQFPQPTPGHEHIIMAENFFHIAHLSGPCYSKINAFFKHRRSLSRLDGEYYFPDRRILFPRPKHVELLCAALFRIY